MKDIYFEERKSLIEEIESESMMLIAGGWNNNSALDQCEEDYEDCLDDCEETEGSEFQCRSGCETRFRRCVSNTED